MIPPEDVGLSAERLDRIQDVMARHVEQERMPGAVTLVARRGEIVHHEAVGYRFVEEEDPLGTDAVFRIASMAKPITCAAAMTLWEEGAFHLSDPIHDYLPEFEDMDVAVPPGNDERIGAPYKRVPVENPITIRHLMTHTAGLPNPYRGLTRSEYLEAARFHENPETVADFVRRLAELPLNFEPGERWEYSRANDVVGRLVEVLAQGVPGDEGDGTYTTRRQRTARAAMSGDERKVLDTSGDFQYVVRDGERVTEPQWRSCRIVVTNKRLLLATSGDKQSIPHANIAVADGAAVPEDAPADATPLSVGDTLLLVDATGVDDFAFEYCRGALLGAVILARSPAVVGGVVQEEAEWSKARFRLDDGTVRLQFPDGGSTAFDAEDVGTVETSESTVVGDQRTVVEVEHTDAQDRSVETHLSGTADHTDALADLFETVVERREDDYELTEMESQVLMALYSGVSPFEMADFVGTTPDEVEEIYQRLLEIGAVDEVRTRTEVTLNAQGRNMASEAMSGE